MGRNRFIWTMAAACAAVLALGSPPPARSHASGAEFDVKAALAASQAAIGRRVGEHSFRDTEDRSVAVSDFRGRPLVVNFIYTGCTGSCPVVTETLAGALEAAREALGADSFHVTTIGLDVPADSPRRMRAYSRAHGVDMPGWTFLSGDLPAVAGLTGDLGFLFAKRPGGIDHMDQITILDAEGRVYQQIYGDWFEAPRLVEPLKNLVFGTANPFSSIDDLVKKVRLFCTIYDPATERYRFDYSIFIQLFVGAFMVLGMAVFVIRGWWRIYRRSRVAAG